MNQRQIAITSRYSYDFNHSLGYGGFGQVYRGYYTVGSHKIEIAVKVICKEILDKNRSLIYNQIKLLKQLDQFEHPNLIKFYDYYQHKEYEEIFLFFELGLTNLQNLLPKNGQKFEQNVAMRYFSDIAEGLSFIHQKGIIHRDIKPVNIVCVGEKLKIIDFGVSRKYFCEGQTNSMTLNVGDKIYQAPQVLSSDYDERCDVWSLGLVLYQMLTGKIQYQNLEQRNYQLEMGMYNFDTNGLGQVQKTLIERMLVYDCKKRAKMTEIMQILYSSNSIIRQQNRSQDSLKRIAPNYIQPNYFQNNNKGRKKQQSNQTENTIISEEQSIIQQIAIEQNMPKQQTQIYLSQRNLSSYQFYSQYDLRLYPRLQTLILNGNNISSINVTHCPQLKKLYLDDNQIEEIYLRKNTKLQQLSMWRNKLYNTWDFLYKNVNLRYLRLSHNKITSIDISRNDKIQTLQLFDNLLSEINLKKNTRLKMLSLFNNQIQNIDLLNNIELQELFISHNQISFLNLQNSSKLKMLSCQYNNLHVINLQKNPNIILLNLSSNNLSQISFWYNPSFIYTKPYNQILNIVKQAFVMKKEISKIAPK